MAFIDSCGQPHLVGWGLVDVVFIVIVAVVVGFVLINQ